MRKATQWDRYRDRLWYELNDQSIYLHEAEGGRSLVGILGLLLCIPVHPVHMAELLISSREVFLAKAALFAAAGGASTGSRSTTWTDFQVQRAAGKGVIR